MVYARLETGEPADPHVRSLVEAFSETCNDFPGAGDVGHVEDVGWECEVRASAWGNIFESIENPLEQYIDILFDDILGPLIERRPDAAAMLKEKIDSVVKQVEKRREA